MIYYFSGTGNSLWAAKKLAEQLDEQVGNLAGYKDKTLVCNDDVIGVVCPTYLMDLPWFVKKILLNANLNKQAYTFLIMTSNNGKSGKAANSMDALLVRNGLSLYAVFDLQMPGNCMESSAEENAQRLASAPARLEAIGKCILSREHNFQSNGVSAADNVVEKSAFSHKKHFGFGAFTFDVTSDCIGCGLCKDICPTQNISIKDGKAVHGDYCAACCGCFHWCPQQATLPSTIFLKKDRSQYHHPEVTVGDMRQKNITT